MHRNKDAERTAYYRQQASACATAALTAAIAEVRQAYLDLEQGWLCLNPKVETSRDDLVYAAPCRDSQSNPPEAPKQNAASSVSRRGDAQA